MSMDTKREYDNEYLNIIEDGEITELELISGLDIMGLSPYENLDGLKLKVSNGLSHVFVYTKYDNVYQMFKKEATVSRIVDILKSVNNTIKTDYVEYDLSKYITNIKKYDIDKKLVVWNKITPLNSFKTEELQKIISCNIFKLLWDIGKALTGLHQNNILHGDCRLDNIGIYEGNFVLFDFDGSRVSDLEEDIFYKDFYDFKKSIEFNLDKNFKKIKHHIPLSETNFLFSLLDKQEIEPLEAVSFLNSLEIIV
jgi:hypothetical protein